MIFTASRRAAQFRPRTFQFKSFRLLSAIHKQRGAIRVGEASKPKLELKKQHITPTTGLPMISTQPTVPPGPADPNTPNQVAAHTNTELN
jgi:hypothetical protein